ncbi:MAG: metal-sulfur cluster assembly factor [SAR202 cluster bacterium]|jgi:metal-sulfur cluster biosynthetic enzyme|nr:metal-sulfur cluster assembly factor [SAR202 cluster bacterium]|tara:strand:- start:1170 stop:1457 length:288 start_codon:yes stop_codon:yes gene_type:complete
MVTKEDIIEVLKNVNDPEIGIDIYTLELIYDVKVEGDKVKIKMTFTTPMCPYGPQLLEEVKTKVNEIEGVKETNVEVTFDPPWEPSQELRATLGV